MGPRGCGSIMPYWLLPGFFEPVAVAYEADDVGVMHDPVDHGRGDGEVAADVTPA